MTGLGAIRAPETIIFGKGQRASLDRSAITIGTRALICTDARLSATPEFAVMIDDLKSSRLVTHIFDQTLAELPLACVEDALRELGRSRQTLLSGLVAALAWTSPRPLRSCSQRSPAPTR